MKQEESLSVKISYVQDGAGEVLVQNYKAMIKEQYLPGCQVAKMTLMDVGCGNELAANGNIFVDDVRVTAVNNIPSGYTQEFCLKLSIQGPGG